ncbi:hypothetical protein QBC41DRAFT_227410 [Cercophora samala]|uniref:Uncharacterized protein n=1 Tax=Cercophora samala TaxID=330535 RepID=A0AA39ZBG5_9PEZI|nr:hypothetical protein QBC41DRAFT_227410 [Cercophora samala]
MARTTLVKDLLVFLAFFTHYAVSVGPPDSMTERFTGLGFLDSGVSGGLNDMPRASYTMAQRSWGMLPLPCYDTAVTNGYCDPHDIDVWDVTYGDCEVPKIFCRCISSPMSIDTLAADFGYKIPVKARQWIDTVSSYPAPEGGCSAWNGGDHLNFFGDCTDKMSVWFHEVAHSLDCWTTPRPPSLPEAFCYSDTPTEWSNIVLNGTCVPDNYAKADWAESWAQVAVMSAWHANVGNVWNLGIGCMQAQMSKSIEQLAGLWPWVENATCDRWWDNDWEEICMGDVARDYGACDGENTQDSSARHGDGDNGGHNRQAVGKERSRTKGLPNDSDAWKKRKEGELARKLRAEERAGLRGRKTRSGGRRG